MSYDVTPDMPFIDHRGDVVCDKCGHEYHLGIYRNCPTCGHAPAIVELATDGPHLSQRRRSNRASADEPTPEGHRMHQEESQNVRETDAYIRSLAAAVLNPENVTDRESFLAFIEALAQENAKPTLALRNATTVTLLGAAVAWARASHGPSDGLAPVASWRDFARFLLAGTLHEL